MCPRAAPRPCCALVEARDTPRLIERAIPSPALLRAFTALLLVALFASPAQADRGQVMIAVSPVASMLKLDQRDPWGGGGAIDFSVGVSDAFAIRLTGAFTSHIAPERQIPDPANAMLKITQRERGYHAYHAGLGVTYVVDILRFVPSLDLAVGLLGSTRYDKDEKASLTYDFGAEIGLNLDYLLSNRFTVGFTVRYHAYLTRITEIPIYLFFGPRFTVRFGG